MIKNEVGPGKKVPLKSAKPQDVKTSKYKIKINYYSTMLGMQAVRINQGVLKREFKSQHCFYLWCEIT